MTPSDASPTQLSPRYRWVVLALLLVAGYLNQFDRQTVSVLKATLKLDFGIDDTGYAVLVNAFTACYAIAYIGSGWVVDRIGPKRALAWFIFVWSLATVGCGLAQSFWVMVMLRALLGLAEPGLFPVTIRTATAWVEDKGRGVFMALGTLGTSIGGITAVPIIAWLTIHLHWRWAFVVPGVLGLAVAWAWWKLYREPARPAAIAAAEPAAVRPPLRWSQLWRERSLWGIVLVRLVSDPVWYFCLFWMPGYLQESKQVSIGLLGVIGWVPFLCANIGGLAFTALSDYRARRDGLRGRKRLVMATAVAGPLCFLIPQASVAMTIVLFCLIAVLCNAWLGSLAPMIARLFPVGNVASVYGISGAFGASGAILFNYLIGQAAGRFGMDPLFIVMGLLHPLAAAIMFFLVREKVSPPPVVPAVAVSA